MFCLLALLLGNAWFSLSLIYDERFIERLNDSWWGRWIGWVCLEGMPFEGPKKGGEREEDVDFFSTRLLEAVLRYMFAYCITNLLTTPFLNSCLLMLYCLLCSYISASPARLMKSLVPVERMASLGMSL